MTAPTPEQAARLRAGITDYTCGLCGEEFGSNCAPGDIECTNDNCEARLCPCCGAWFTEDGETSRPAAAQASVSPLAEGIENLIGSLDKTVERGTHAEEFDQGAAHASAVTARQLRELLAAPPAHREPQPAPGLEAAFASGMRVRTVPCTVDAHDGEHFQVRTNGHWLCGHLLASMLIAQGIVADPEAQPAPGRAELEALVRDAVRASQIHIPDLPCPACDPRIAAVMAAIDVYATARPAQPAPELAEARTADDVSRAVEDIAAVISSQLGTLNAAANQGISLLRYVASDRDRLRELLNEARIAEPQPAPELAAAMRESRHYREALQKIATSNTETGRIAKRALEGK